MDISLITSEQNHQISFESPVNNEDQRPAKKRIKSEITLIACVRCKSKKLKCDGDFNKPSTRCSNCTKSNSSCLYNQDHIKNPNYIKALQSKISSLEKEIQELKTANAIVVSSVDTESIRSRSEEANGEDPDADLLQYAAYIPLVNESDYEPLYIGGSSGFSLGSLFVTSLVNELKGQQKLQNYEEDPSGKSQIDLDLEDVLKDKDLIDVYINSYLSTIHLRYPFLSSTYISTLQNRPFSKLQTVEKFMFLMILAVGSRNVMNITTDLTKIDQLQKLFDRNIHSMFYQAALKLDNKVIFVFNNLSNIHALLLLVIYLLRAPNGSIIWHLIRISMGICVNFGLHRRNYELFQQNPLHYQIRCKTFWSAYSLERVISNSFGRPYSVSDRDIDIDLPVDIDDTIVDNELIRYHFKATYPHYNDNKQVIVTEETEKERTSMTMAIYYFKLRKIDSEIQNSIYRVDNNTQEIPITKINELKTKMKNWISTLPISLLTTTECDYCLFLFNKQIRSLIHPYLTRLPSGDPFFEECIKSSITICTLTKKLHQNFKIHSSYQQSFITLQTLFLSGITIIYALLSRKYQWDFNASEGLRSCSSVLFLFAEKSKSCIHYRDVFERLVSKVKASYGFDGSLTAISIQDNTVDLFGQGNIKEKLMNDHMTENMDLFNKLTTETQDGTRDEDDLLGNLSIDRFFEDLWDNVNNELNFPLDPELCIDYI